MQICVTGANGFIGRHLMCALSRCGHSARVLTRRENHEFATNVQVFSGDLARPDCPLDQFIKDCDILFHCAGEVRDTKAMRLLHIDGTKRLVQSVLTEHARTGRILHWVQLSSVGAYGPPEGKAQTDRIVTEDTVGSPVNEYEVTKSLSDELVIQACASGAMTYSILRPSNVYSEGGTNRALERLAALVRSRLFFYIGRPGAVATYVHVDDVAAALVACAFDLRARGRIYNLSNDCFLEDLVRHIASSMGLREPWLRVPEAVIRIPLDLCAGLFRGSLHIPSINALVLRTRYPSGRIESELDFRFSRPMPASIVVGEGRPGP